MLSNLSASGSGQTQLNEWAHTRAKADVDVSWLREVVGVDIARTRDEGLYRVLDWGGMEVPR